jgi:hypothetical protein
MPNLDKTGPNGEGPMTGGGFGICGGRRIFGSFCRNPGRRLYLGFRRRRRRGQKQVEEN